MSSRPHSPSLDSPAPPVPTPSTETRRPPRIPRHTPLVRDTLRAHRAGALVWVAAGGLTMFGMAAALAREMADFPGGAQALGASVAAAAEALRPLRWPAERLDTLGGYLTYHNVTLYALFLGLYGVVQGSHDIRGAEERGSLEEVLATGHPRAAVVRDRTLGFAVIMALVSLGLGLCVAAGMQVGDEPDLGGSLITMAQCGLVGLFGYALSLLVSQLVGSARAASGTASALLCVLYVTTNMGQTLGALDVLRFASPFHYANQSRALVPGHGLDVAATAALVGLSAAMVALAHWAFVRRDYDAALWPRRAAPVLREVRPGHVPHRMLGAVWTSVLRRGWVGLVAWAAGGAALAGMLAALQPRVMDLWDMFSFIGQMSGAGGATSFEDAYWSFTGEMISPVIAAYVITQASGWVADLAQGRVEITLAGPVTWTMLVLQRLVATVVGVGVLIAGTLAGLAAGAWAVDSSLDVAGVARVVLVGLLLGAALASLAAIVVAVVRRSVAVTVLAVLVAASYVVAYLVPVFQWPEWLDRLSVFWAFGHPYLEWPSTARIVVLVTLAVPGALLAAALAERTPKVA